MLRRQVDYFALLSRYPDERAVIDAVLERIVDILQAEDDQKYALASTLTLPVYHLKKQFLSVDGRILGSVLDRCSQNRSRAGAYISYVLVSLYRESNRPGPAEAATPLIQTICGRTMISTLWIRRCMPDESDI